MKEHLETARWALDRVNAIAWVVGVVVSEFSARCKQPRHVSVRLYYQGGEKSQKATWSRARYGV